MIGFLVTTCGQYGSLTDSSAAYTLQDAAGTRNSAASGAWVDERTYALKLCFVETPYHPTVTLRFDGDTAAMALHPNVGWDGVGGVELTGRAE